MEFLGQCQFNFSLFFDAVKLCCQPQSHSFEFWKVIKSKSLFFSGMTMVSHYITSKKEVTGLGTDFLIDKFIWCLRKTLPSHYRVTPGKCIRGSDAIFWLLWAPDIHVVYRHICRQNMVYMK